MYRAELNNYRQSPRKMRLVAAIVRGKSVSEALDILTLTARASSLPLKKLIQSAVANAKHNHGVESNLYIKELRVDEGVTMHRMMPRARGSGAPIKKRSCHVTVILAVKGADEVTKTTESISDSTSASVKDSKEEVKKTEVKKVKAKKPAKKAVKKNNN